MQRCLQCGETFKYKQILISGSFGYKPITCRSCGQIHKVTFGSRMRVALLAAFAPFIITILLRPMLFDGASLFEELLLYMVVLIPFILLIPILMRYRS